jgi:ubiquitin-protein ligase
MSINNNTIKRIAKDVKYILNNEHSLSLENIYYKHDEENIMRGYALIIGQKNTPYGYGYYFFEFTFPDNYPFSPPLVRYLTNDGTMRFNPNLYTNGKVCLSLLNTWSGESWTSCQTINSILLTLSIVLCENPLLNEPGVQINNNTIEKYNYLVTYKNIEFALCKIINYIQNYTDTSNNASNNASNNTSNNDDIKIIYKFKSIVYETFINNKNSIIDYLNENKIKYAKFIDENYDNDDNDKNNKNDKNDKNNKNDKNDKNELTIQKKKKIFISMYNLTYYLDYTKLYNLVLDININKK